MHLNLKYLFALVAAPLALANIEDPCNANGQAGVCLRTTDCKLQSGQQGSAYTIRGYCPKDPSNVLCCIKTVSRLTTGQYLSNPGRCKNVSQCSTSTNTIYNNQCPGSSRVKLCVPKKTQWEVMDLYGYRQIQDYATVAKKVDGVILRCGYRDFHKDGKLMKEEGFENHYKNFLGKTKIGYYFSTQAITTSEAAAEADFVIDNLIKGKQNNFPIFINSEYSPDPDNNARNEHLSVKVRTDCVIAFINRVKNRGYRAGLFAPNNWTKNYLDINRILATGATFWVSSVDGVKPTLTKYDMWQYSWGELIAGDEIFVDRVSLSHVYKNIANW